MSDISHLAKFNDAIEQAIKARIAAEAAYGRPEGTGSHVGDSRLREYADQMDKAKAELRLMSQDVRITMAGVLLAVEIGAKLR